MVRNSCCYVILLYHLSNGFCHVEPKKGTWTILVAHFHVQIFGLLITNSICRLLSCFSNKTFTSHLLLCV
ncbi:hypothetical protein NC652_015705 [Populus alba x Populus x berolinensis]|uniref:Uncharacterized protein n=1 Tax=Populus alba x Populus x berolinensis TaxID=444605 RepID=A0AAD6QL18_9ROSI|nr:hypothetical protein NC652_015705 [Populus alba x Populus x berolinensis]KAJ6992353.1 hypothetical protein NC653_015666 [Populus alba x Populus x berolinensis]